MFSDLFATLPRPIRVAVLETPAGFELNSRWVAQQVALFLENHLPNFDPQVDLIPARRRESEYGPDNPEILTPLLEASVIYLGAGSPTYAARQLKSSLAWETTIARHRLGASLILASAATVAASAYALPVYEIYKVGEDLHWKDGLDLLGPWGISLAIVPHWNNKDGGAHLDTSRCFMGQSRFEQLMDMLPGEAVVMGIEEHSALSLDLQSANLYVKGKGGLVLIQDGQETHFASGEKISLKDIGSYKTPQEGASIPVRVCEAYTGGKAENKGPLDPPEEIQELVKAREEAREREDWVEADRLRQQIQDRNWQVHDTITGPELVPNSAERYEDKHWQDHTGC